MHPGWICKDWKLWFLRCENDDKGASSRSPKDKVKSVLLFNPDVPQEKVKNILKSKNILSVTEPDPDW